MSRIFISLLTVLIAVFTFEQCANPTAITGGEKDTIPPSLIESWPGIQSLEVDERTFTYVFSEAINADKLQQELLITPTTDNKFTYLIKKNILTLKFEESFSDSTTYTFNFREGVGDATERNSVENFRFAFSTGPFIDSLSIRGKVTSTSTEDAENDFLVGLYIISDTLLTTAVKPYYFYSTDKNGYYELENLRAGKYLLFTFKDTNNNLLFNPKDESFGVYPDTIQIDNHTKADTFNISTVSINAEQLRRISARPSGNQFQIRYSKPIIAKMIDIDSKYSRWIYPQLSPDKSEILLYKHKMLEITEEDSIQVFLHVKDTLQHLLLDTVYAKFITTQRKPKELTLSINNLSQGRDTLKFNVASSKPINEILASDVFIKIDTVISINPDTLYLQPKKGFTGEYNGIIPVKLETLLDSANSLLPDTLKLMNARSMELTLSTSSVLSIEQDTLPEPLSIPLTQTKVENLGTLNLKIETEKTSFELRLLNKKGDMIRNSFNQKQITYDNLPPDTYRIEIYIDSNQNGIWEVANPWKNTASEQIYIYPTTTELKANWIIDIENISF